MIGEVFLRYSDFQKDTLYQMVLKNVERSKQFAYSFLKFKAYMMLDHNKKEFTVIFPKWKFRREYIKFPVELRTKIGNQDMLIEFYKRDGGRLEITNIEKYVK